jgi:CRP-like cAMP-binding protein
MSTKSTEQLPSEISRLEKLLQKNVKCLAYLVLQTKELKGKPNRDLIPILARLGFERKDIAELLQTTPETVSVRLSQLKAGKKKSARKDEEPNDK